MFLRLGLHPHMVERGQGLGVGEMLRQGGVGTEFLAEPGHRVVDHLLLGARAVGHQHLAGVAHREHRLDARRDVAGEQRDGAGGGDRGDQGVADTMFGDALADVPRQGADDLALEILVAVEQREGALLAGQLHRGAVGGVLQGLQPAPGLRHRRVRAVAQPGHQQGIRQPGDAEPEAPLGQRLGALRLEREARDIDHVVHHPDGDGDQTGQFRLVDGCFGGRRRLERLAHQGGEVDRAEQAGAVGGEGLLAAGIT